MACIAGSSMRVTRNRGATACNAYTNGVLLHGIRLVQAEPARLQPVQPPEPILYIAGAPVTREHGSEAKADQDASQA